MDYCYYLERLVTTIKASNLRFCKIVKNSRFIGFCDIFRKCRSVDASGALAKLKNFLTNKENLETASKWVKVGFFEIACSVH